MEFTEEFFEFGVGEEEGVTTGEADVTDWGGLFEIFDRVIPLGFEFLIRDAGDDT